MEHFEMLHEQPLGNVTICQGKPYQRVRSSKFCARTFLKLRNNALDLANSIFSDVTVLYQPPSQETLKAFMKNTQSGSEKNEYLYFEIIQDKDSHRTLSEIYKKFKVIEKGSSMVLVGYSLLTQLNVGILHILARTFESLGFIPNNSFGCIIILKCYLAVDNILECFKKVYEAAIEADAQGKAVLSVLPITELCESNLYSCIVDMNHWMVKHYVNHLTELVQTKIKA